eukprot:CAMPEP_0172678714 /NCGR_PEP_ID=MMETSP1074-20121228/15592_1 /TAXON_ID=2916 /ORGANISM="Ceratium fusus, Strain PA161109" /LENGTH=40 /DNA_ID= /DNA_START= /DNA_END= /DNA_ORIENTATION=
MPNRKILDQLGVLVVAFNSFGDAVAHCCKDPRGMGRVNLP